MFMVYESVKSLEFDLITTCNAYCPTCLRYEVQDNQLYRNPFIDFNKGLDLSIIEDIASSKILDSHAQIDFVGLLGDAVAHKEFLEIVKLFLLHKPECSIQIHTNGGLRDENFFYQLGELLSGDNHEVRFSIDGLSDTNHLYRIRVNFDKALNNMKSFISGGGKAIWQFVDFPWNHHQIEKARELSDSLGCKKFIVRENAQELDRLKIATDAATNKIINKPSNSSASKSAYYTRNYFGEVQQDECISDSKVYINNNGEVVPCCFINGLKFESETTVDYKIFMKNQDNWNNLNNYSFDNIMKNSWWEALSQNLKCSPHGACVQKCGLKKC